MGTLCEAILTSTHNRCFEQKYEEYQIFYLKIFLFLVIKFSVYLNRHVSVMILAVCYSSTIVLNMFRKSYWHVFITKRPPHILHCV